MPKPLLFTVFFYLFTASFATAQCLSGIYTLGSAGDFPTFQSACAALETQGVCGPVEIRVPAGSYQEQVSLGAIPGASATNTVVFRGADSVAFNTNLAFYFDFDFPGDAWVLRLAQTAHVRFEHLTFEQQGPGFEANCVELVDVQDITFRKCWFWRIPHPTQTDDAIGLWAHGTGLQNLLAERCEVFGFATGIRIEGQAGDPVEGVQLKNNSVHDCPSRLAYLLYCTSPLLRGNDFTFSTAYFLYEPWVALEGGTGGRLEKNQFRNYSYVGKHQLWYSNQTGSPAAPCEIVNNFFYGANNNALIVQQSGEVHFANNTVRTGTGAQFGALNGTLHLLNNLFNTYQSVYEIAGFTFSNLHSDYNVFSPLLAEDVTGNDFPTLAEWQAVSGQDAHSVVKQVAFTGQYPGWQTIPPDPVLDGKALVLPFVTDDFGGEARDPVSPDIGADEFSIPARDVAVSQALVDAPGSPGCAGEAVGFSLSISNNGTDTLQSMRIAVSVAGLPFDTLDWQGSLPPEAGVPKTVAVGSLIPPAHKVQFTFKVLEVNGLPDTTPDDNTAETALVRIGMKGTFHVNGLNGDFQNLHETADTLADRGVCGEAIFILDPGRYYEPRIELNNIRGASATNRIVFSSPAAERDAVVLELEEFPDPGTGDRQFKIINTAGVTFRNLTFYHRPYSNHTIHFIDAAGCRDLQVENCVFESASFGLLLTGDISGLTVRNCSFQRLLRMVYHEGSLATSHDVRIEDNHFGESDYFYGCFELRDVDGLTMRRNYLDGHMRLLHCRNGEISDNRIRSFYGNYVTRMTLSNNLFVNHKTSEAFYLDNFTGNNMTLLHNTVIASTSIPAMSLGADTLIFQNNIVVNYGTGTAIELGPDTTVSSSQNNLFYAAQAPYMLWSGYNAYTTDSLWRKVWKMDTLSVFADPLISEQHAWLPQNGTATASRGLDWRSLVPRDFGGQDRDEQPDLGAVEFSGHQADLQVELADGTGGADCHGVPLVRVRVHNLSGATVHRFEAGWTVNDSLLTPYAWSGDLAPGAATDWLELGYYFFRYEGDSLKVWTTHSLENNYANDTLLLPDHRRLLGGTYTVGGVGADFPQFDRLDDAINVMGVCDSSAFLLRTGYYAGYLGLYRIKGDKPVLIRSAAANRDSVVLGRSIFQGYGGVTLAGASHVTLQSLTLHQPGSVGIGAWGLNQAVHNALIDCIVPGDVTIDCDTNLVEGCLFAKSVLRSEGGFAGFYYDTISFLTIRNNVFEADLPVWSADPTPVYLSDQRYLKLEGNYFHEGRPVLGERWRIGCEVTGNTFDNNPGGLNVNTWPYSGMPSLLVANNFFWIDTSSVKGAGAPVSLAGQNFRFVHNTVWANFNSDISSFIKSSALNIQGAPIVFQNNQVHTTGTIVAANLDTTGLSSDYNNFHTDGGWVYYNYTDNEGLQLGQWQSDFGQDAHSTAYQQRFLFEDLGGGHDLHLSPDNVFLVRSENPLADVPTDIDGEARDFFEPCAGADERDGPDLSQFVWPGDANRDKSVSNEDFLFVGLGAGLQLTGPVRADPSTDWSPKASADWPGYIAGVNAKNSDSDGNGAITAADTLAVVQNFNQEHFLLPEPETEQLALQLFIANPPSQVTADQTLALEVHLTDPDGNPVALHGLAFTLSLSENAVVPGSLRFVPASAGWLGVSGQDLWTTALPTADPGILQIALTRHDAQNATGSGLIGHIYCTTADNTAGSSLSLGLACDLALQNDGNILPAGGGSQSWPILVPTQETPAAGALLIYPTPADRMVWVTNSGAGLLRLRDAFGRVVLDKSVSGESIVLQRENLPGGVYWLEAWADGRRTGTGKVVWR